MDPEVLIVGGGVIGLSIGRELRARGAGRVMVLDKGACGQEASWAAGGMLAAQAEADGRDIFFDLCARSRDLYPAFASGLLAETGVDIELEQSGTLYLSFSDDDSIKIRERYDWQAGAGLSAQMLTAADVRRSEPFVSPAVREGIFFPDDWQVDNRKLLAALQRYAEINGIEIREGVHVEAISVENGRVIGVETGREMIHARHTILATGAWTSFIKLGDTDLPVKVDPVRGQMIVFQTAKRLFQKVIYSPRGYLIPRLDGRVLAGSTTEHEGFDKIITEAAAAKIRAVADEIAPSTAGLPISAQWAGLRPFAGDGLPVLGGLRGIEALTIATAHYRNGILLAPITAALTAERVINGGSSPYFDAFGPDRFRFTRSGRLG